MKYILLPFLLFLFSCSKDPVSSGTTESSIEYKVNGNYLKIDNTNTVEYAVISKQIAQTRYLLNAQKGSNNSFVMVVATDSMRPVNYHYTNTFPTSHAAFVMNYNGQSSALYSPGDYIDVNISNHSGGHASGTFTAKFTPYTAAGYGTPGSVVITEGKLNNVQVIY